MHSSARPLTQCMLNTHTVHALWPSDFDENYTYLTFLAYSIPGIAHCFSAGLRLIIYPVPATVLWV